MGTRHVCFESAVLGHKPAILRSYPEQPLHPALRGEGDAGCADITETTRLAKLWIAALADARWSDFKDALDDDVVLQVAGAVPESGTFRGRDAVEARSRAFAEHFSAGSLRLDGVPRLVCASAEGFCILRDIVGRLADGLYKRTFGLVGSPHGGAVGEVQLFFGTAAEDAQLYGNPISGRSQIGSSEPFTIDRRM